MRRSWRPVCLRRRQHTFREVRFQHSQDTHCTRGLRSKACGIRGVLCFWVKSGQYNPQTLDLLSGGGHCQTMGNLQISSRLAVYGDHGCRSCCGEWSLGEKDEDRVRGKQRMLDRNKNALCIFPTSPYKWPDRKDRKNVASIVSRGFLVAYHTPLRPQTAAKFYA